MLWTSSYHCLAGQKLESKRARKRTISSTHQPYGYAQRQASLSPKSITVAKVSQLCAAKRTDCVLVVIDEERPSRIFTAKVLAHGVTADGLDLHHTPTSQIMKQNPMVTRDTTNATDSPTHSRGMLREVVRGKLTSDPTDFTLSYMDVDGDMVLIMSNSDAAHAVKDYKNQKFGSDSSSYRGQLTSDQGWGG